MKPGNRKGSRCRLVRADGTEWRVLELRGGEQDLRVDAVPTGDGATDNGNGSQASHGSDTSGNGSSGNGTPRSDGDPHQRLKDELLGRGDRLQWLDEDGGVLWSMKLPMDQARSA